ncbi:glycoside hydrolase family 31 protein [Tenacibaculum tangerinum]|uniref:Glycoside hydrolase family 31 protein n=1 Tax=Tenacibaculum tangerinum TaxID=3038772 RepID=A0ABY8L3G5_9FLAO|nr:TIM-barrel domain-containing protein [Tenacibaculum tangerinum]WGH75967.1 glycoside hydrolase family 31 protein [Tenacibaculum tangerinum]
MIEQNLKQLRSVIIMLGVWLISYTSLAQNAGRKFIKFEQQANENFIIKVNDGTYRIQFYTPEIVETTFIPEGQEFIKKSHAVVLVPKHHKTTLHQEENFISFKVKNGITVKIQKSPFKISYYYEGKELTSEKQGYQSQNDGEHIQLNLTPEEVLYGGGARALGMNRRGYRLQLYNRAHYGYETHAELMNYTMPIVISSKKYLLHFDNAPIGFLDLDSQKNNTLTYETISGRKTYQVIAGKTWVDILNNYTELTGKQPMLPRWALGNFASRFGYHSQKEVENTIQKFQDEKIPVDAIILDLYWFGKDIKGTMGNLEVYKDSFPDFEGMIQRLKKKGVKTITITEPFVLTTSTKWKEAVEKDVLAKDSVGNPAKYDFYFGNTGIIDIFKPEGKQWFWSVYEKLAKKGVAGVWGDLGEPEVHPDWVQHATGTANEVHNIYGHHWVKLVAEGYQEKFPTTRPFILMRAGYSGSQRYGMIPWSGDVNRTWGGLQSQPEIALQMGMQGLAFMHSDLGGFAGNNLDDELYVRWLQYGVFQPIFRPHAQEEVPAEPVFRESRAKQLAKEAIELRYKLLPYNYTLLYKNHKLGTPLMQPLFFEEESKHTQEVVSTYLWGSNFLISPITQSKITTQSIYFPNTSNWFDFYTGKKFAAGSTVSYKTSENSIPTFVRGGAFIPMAKPMQHTESYKGSNLDIHYYYDSEVVKSNDVMYNDDGVTPNAFEKGAYELLTFKSNNTTKRIILELKANTGENYNTNQKQIDFTIHNISKKPTYIKKCGKKIPFKWSPTTQKVQFSTDWNTKEVTKFKLKLTQ